MGIMPLSLAIVAVIWRRESKEYTQTPQAPLRHITIGILAAISLFFLALSLRIPGIDLILHLPIFNVVAAPRYRLVYTFCVAVLAGFGADQLFHRSFVSTILRWLIGGLLGYVLGAITLLAVASWAVVAFKEQLITFNRLRLVYPLLLQAFWPPAFAVYFPIFFALLSAALIWGYRRGLVGIAAARIVCLALVLADLWVFGAGFNPTVPAADLFPQTPSTTALQALMHGDSAGRIVAMNDDLPPNTAMPYGISDIAGVDFPSRRYTELAQHMGAIMPDHFRLAFPRILPQMLTMMGVEYIVASKRPNGLAADRFPEVYRSATIHVYKNTDALPRAYFAADTIMIGDDAQILQLLTSARFDPARQTILEGPLPDTIHLVAHKYEPVQLVSYAPERVELHVPPSSEGMLVLSDAYYPGWTATIDGAVVPIYRANYALRAVYVPHGSHTVVFSYQPTWLWWGVAFSVLGVVILSIISLYLAKCKRNECANSQHATSS